MLTFFAIIHIIIALLLIVLVLIQDSKGDAMGMFGGGGGTNTVLGTGAATFLVKVTRWIAIIFAVTCISLVYMTTKKNKSVLDKFAPPTSPAQSEGMGGKAAAPTTDKAKTAPAAPKAAPAKEATTHDKKTESKK